MLTGKVSEYLPLLRLDLPGHSGTISVELVVDTGFDGYLALPRTILAQLDCTETGTQVMSLADRSRRETPTYEILLEWLDDEEMGVEVLEMPGNPLIGMRLLERHLLSVEVADGGEVTIEPF